ncbi:MAG: sulfotransferase [Novosphingobium sp.]|nr:sulfotransferase [Novosphingobium sp.]
MALDVIGAGYGRTGTLTLKTALEMLGFGPCHHMLEVMGDPAQVAFWNRAADGESVDWEEVYANYRSTVDWPGCHFYGELADRYPDARVILSSRDPKAWHASMSETILKGMEEMGLKDEVPKDHPMYFGAVMIAQHAFGFDYSLESATAALERHNSAVRSTIPENRLLEFEVSDGWEPLCAFLGLPVPDAPFPRTNERENFGEHIETAKGVARDLGGD